jgi:hypothetical protein
MMDDFPAAHSMDTMWYAVDRDGHVAVLDTLEAGALPTELPGTDGYDAFEALQQLPASGAIVDRDGYTALGPAATPHVDVTERDAVALAFVDDVEPVRALVDELGARVLRATRGFALAIPPGNRPAFQELHARGACVRCQFHWNYPGTELAEHGLYYYRHITENWIAGPYARLHVPAAPLADLPPVLRDLAIRFDGRFADTVELQPAERWPCRAWSASWLATDHQTIRSFETGEIVTDDDD